MSTEELLESKEAYNRWYMTACGIALKFGEGTTVSGKAPDVNGVYPDPVITIPTGLRFTVGRPPGRES